MDTGKTHLFILGKDYHLGDLLWFTAVLRAYRARVGPERLLVACPDRPISQILDRHPLIDELILYSESRRVLAAAQRRYGADLVLHNLRPLSIALSMMRQWRYRWPWLYLRDLWLGKRGQWLATFLRLGRLEDVRPMLQLDEADRVAARTLPPRTVVLVPHIGHYALRPLNPLWQRIKEWDAARWSALATALRHDGYEPVTLAAVGQAVIPGTWPILGLPIRQAAGVIEQASAVVTVESGLWYVAAALGRPFVIVPWWLPRSLDWAAPMGVAHRLITRDKATAGQVLRQLRNLLADNAA